LPPQHEEDAYARFRDEKLMPAVRQAFGDNPTMQNPPPQESFEAKHLISQASCGEGRRAARARRPETAQSVCTPP